MQKEVYRDYGQEILANIYLLMTNIYISMYYTYLVSFYYKAIGTFCIFVNDIYFIYLFLEYNIILDFTFSRLHGHTLYPLTKINYIMGKKILVISNTGFHTVTLIRINTYSFYL